MSIWFNLSAFWFVLSWTCRGISSTVTMTCRRRRAVSLTGGRSGAWRRVLPRSRSWQWRCSSPAGRVTGYARNWRRGGAATSRYQWRRMRASRSARTGLGFGAVVRLVTWMGLLFRPLQTLVSVQIIIFQFVRDRVD